MTAVICRFCGGSAGSFVLDLGLLPSTGVGRTEPVGAELRVDVRLWLCAECGLVQLPMVAGGADVAGPAAFPDPGVASEVVAWLMANSEPPDTGMVLEIPGPGGRSWSQVLAGRSLRPVTDPAAAADIVIDARFALMCAADQRHALLARARRLRSRGLLVLHFPSLAALLARRRWDQVRPGVNAYYSIPAVVEMLARVGLTARAAQEFPEHGTAAVIAGRTEEEDDSVSRGAERHLRVGVRSVEAYGELQSAVDNETAALRACLKDYEFGEVYGYGVTPRAVALLNRAGLSQSDLAAVVDPSATSRLRRVPGTSIPVVDVAALTRARPRAVVAFGAELLPQARRAASSIEASGGTWLTTTPAGPPEGARR